MNFVLADLELPVRIIPERPMTNEDLMRFCAANDTVRIERDANGELIVMSPSGSGTGQTNSQLNYQLARWADEAGSGTTFDSNAGFTLPDGSMRSPDAAWISWPRWNALTRDEQQRFAPICPEFVIELRSPSDSLSELQMKMGIWTVNGAELAWLVDPSRKIVEIHRPGRLTEVLEGGSAIEGDGPVAGFVLELAKFGTNSYDFTAMIDGNPEIRHT